MLTIENSGIAIKQTNFWQTIFAKNGYIFVSTNAGAIRLLIPEQCQSIIDELKAMKKEPSVSLIYSKDQSSAERDQYTFMFDDFTDSPFCISTSHEQWQQKLSDEWLGKEALITLWTKGRHETEPLLTLAYNGNIIRNDQFTIDGLFR